MSIGPIFISSPSKCISRASKKCGKPPDTPAISTRPKRFVRLGGAWLSRNVIAGHIPRSVSSAHKTHLRWGHFTSIKSIRDLVIAIRAAKKNTKWHTTSQLNVGELSDFCEGTTSLDKVTPFFRPDGQFYWHIFGSIFFCSGGVEMAQLRRVQRAHIRSSGSGWNQLFPVDLVGLIRARDLR